MGTQVTYSEGSVQYTGHIYQDNSKKIQIRRWSIEYITFSTVKLGGIAICILNLCQYNNKVAINGYGLNYLLLHLMIILALFKKETAIDDCIKSAAIATMAVFTRAKLCIQWVTAWCIDWKLPDEVCLTFRPKFCGRFAYEQDGAVVQRLRRGLVGWKAGSPRSRLKFHMTG